MPPSSLFFLFLTGSVLGLSAASDSSSDDSSSIITNSPLQETVHQKSVITDSELTRCNIDRSGVESTTGQGSTVAFSSVNNSTLMDSVLNATYCDEDVDKASTSEILSNMDRYYFNRVSDSRIVNTKMDVSPNCRSSNPGRNSTVYKSYINDSIVRISEVVLSNLTSDSSSCLSEIGLSNLIHTNAVNSVIRKLESKDCSLSNAQAESSICERSTVMNGRLEDSTVMYSSLQNSRVTKSSHVVQTMLSNSGVSGNSKVFNSRITNSKVTNSKLTNCTIMNSHVDGQVWDSKIMMNGMLFPMRFF